MMGLALILTLILSPLLWYLTHRTVYQMVRLTREQTDQRVAMYGPTNITEGDCPVTLSCLARIETVRYLRVVKDSRNIAYVRTYPPALTKSFQNYRRTVRGGSLGTTMKFTMYFPRLGWLTLADDC